MSGITMKVTGLDEVLKKLDVKKYEQDISIELDNFGKAVVRDAQNNLSLNGTVDEGGLSGSVGSETKGLNLTIFANRDYAAYIEFGTRKFAAAYVAKLPAQWKILAATFKGSGGGGSFAQFVKAITEWVKRKGFAAQKTKSGNKSKSKASVAGEEQAAYLIARSIIINGIKAQPFLFPAFEKNLPKLLENLKALFKK